MIAPARNAKTEVMTEPATPDAAMVTGEKRVPGPGDIVREPFPWLPWPNVPSARLAPPARRGFFHPDAKLKRNLPACQVALSSGRQNGDSRRKETLP